MIREDNVAPDVLDDLPQRIRDLIDAGADTIMVAIRPLWRKNGEYNLGVIWHMPDEEGGSVEEEWERWRPHENP